MTEKAKYPFQANSIDFKFKQDDKGYWTTDAKMSAERSEDGTNWEIAEVKLRILDKDYAKAVVTCWEVFQKIQTECDGDIFVHKDSELSTLNMEEELKELEG